MTHDDKSTAADVSWNTSLISRFPTKHRWGHAHQSGGMWSPCWSLLFSAEHGQFSSLFCELNVKSWIPVCASEPAFSVTLSPWVGGCAVCGVTIARSNASRMDPNHKMLSSQHVSPPGQGEISESLLKNLGLVPLKNRWLGNTCS